MCELFGVTSDHKVKLDKLLEIFFSHSVEHPNGWGLALFDDGNLSIEKEPVRAFGSQYLKSRLSGHIESSRMMAHIRRATVGDINFNNTHPFTGRDESGRTWTLIHNGTIFESSELTRYQCFQKGTTDSERILLYLIDRMNSLLRKGTDLSDVAPRIEVIDDLIKTLSHNNKLNLLIFDGEYFYVHKNEKGTLFRLEHNGATLLSTKPLTREGWEEIPQNRLLVYKDGSSVFEGDPHNNTYVMNEENMRTLFLGYSGL